MDEINISDNNQIQDDIRLPQGITIQVPESNINFIDKLRAFFGIALMLFMILSVITLSIILLIGNGYLTELLFTNSCLNTYQSWQLDFMRLTVIFFWIQMLVTLIYTICQKKSN